jgi:hypothetical protein
MNFSAERHSFDHGGKIKQTLGRGSNERELHRFFERYSAGARCNHRGCRVRWTLCSSQTETDWAVR